MDYIISGVTDAGISRKVNQDAFCIRRYRSSAGPVVLAVLADGMGGLSQGELASASMVSAMKKWADERLKALASGEIHLDTVRSEWESLLHGLNAKILEFGAKTGSSLGTTVVAILFAGTRFLAVNIGDSRIYEISDSLRLLTRDQSFVMHEVEMGRLTPEQAEKDPRRSILLQCVGGAGDDVYPEFTEGEIKEDAVYMLCSDGFRHEVHPEEIFENLKASRMNTAEEMRTQLKTLIRLNKERNEKDNITAAAIRTFSGGSR
ncbi:MAG: serine/threonine-protein phosphatase [Lachnospiraceae bacterium]|nr:serine/threonine-protein phosphatase [Lachnospiraceae bacterium]